MRKLRKKTFKREKKRRSKLSGKCLLLASTSTSTFHRFLSFLRLRAKITSRAWRKIKQENDAVWFFNSGWGSVKSFEIEKKKTASLRIWYYYYTPLWERNFSVVSLLQVFLSLFSFFLVDRFVAWRNVSYFFFFLLLRVTKTLTNKSRNDTQPNWLSARLSDARIYLLEWQGKRKDLERERKKKVRPH